MYQVVRGLLGVRLTEALCAHCEVSAAEREISRRIAAVGSEPGTCSMLADWPRQEGQCLAVRRFLSPQARCLRQGVCGLLVCFIISCIHPGLDTMSVFTVTVSATLLVMCPNNSGLVALVLGFMWDIHLMPAKRKLAATHLTRISDVYPMYKTRVIRSIMHQLCLRLMRYSAGCQ